jgi:hypothetical protein
MSARRHVNNPPPARPARVGGKARAPARAAGVPGEAEMHDANPCFWPDNLRVPSRDRSTREPQVAGGRHPEMCADGYKDVRSQIEDFRHLNCDAIHHLTLGTLQSTVSRIQPAGPAFDGEIDRSSQVSYSRGIYRTLLPLQTRVSEAASFLLAIESILHDRLRIVVDVLRADGGGVPVAPAPRRARKARSARNARDASN